ncbi:adenine deaminase C-terminal domain-containing protein [Priestia koreensis]|uniref:adenine deaminase C-terminal domain-containing protein n=1 Tax=Priestia koreensis TaxID=284581 RepID=UPI001F5A23F2|nr:adenine deaminase C-terminal domain-containing protein [Priestia koreensis]UNL85254.1 adenine deaminase [Priestia koreensis]
MLEQRYRWKNKELREHVEVLNGSKAPTIILQNATFLHSFLRNWLTANIWIYEDRIVYVGEKWPANLNGTEVVDCTDQFVVPGYIEPHVHPFQLYNPQTFAEYASIHGTTTLVNDNLVLALQSDKKKAFSLVKKFSELPATMYWWCRFDGQTEFAGEDHVFSNGNVKSWLENEAVIQGGELTAWPKLLNGDDMMLHWVQETKRLKKKVEGHFPGASEMTLGKMKLLGADCDHEAMTGQDVLKRLMHGYHVSLRHSSIRPDLPVLLKEMQELGITCYDQITMNSDGSTPSFYQDGVSDMLVKIAIEQGVPLIDAYHMVSFNVANYYNLGHLHGSITTGRIANLNILRAKDDPTPVSVLAKGQWVLKDGINQRAFNEFPWEEFDVQPLQLDWTLTKDDLQFSMPLGLHMKNTVIMKPYSINMDISVDELPEGDESFLMLADRNGKWRINTLIKGFASNVSGFVSSFSNTGDIIIIGKNKDDMLIAFKRMKELGGGIVLVENGEVIAEIPLLVEGSMSHLPMDELVVKEEAMIMKLRERGYTHSDPIYSLLFLSSTHLPYIRITPNGIYDVMKKEVLFPTIMR